MSFPKSCCTLPPVESNYIPKGIESSLGDLTLYETGDNTSDRLLICAYDIFGLHPNTKQFCDKLGSSGFRVVMPDFFRGEAISGENFPPADRSLIMNFVMTKGSYEKVVQHDLIHILEKYKKLGVNGFGIFGFCWGAKMCVEASQSAQFSRDLKASVIIHPSMVTSEDAAKVNCPTLALPAKDDADMIPFFEKIKEKFGADGSGHHRFEDMTHGFAAARGNMDDELNRKRVDEALSMTYDFFNRNIK